MFVKNSTPLAKHHVKQPPKTSIANHESKEKKNLKRNINVGITTEIP
jgi:hypothetical protein